MKIYDFSIMAMKNAQKITDLIYRGSFLHERLVPLTTPSTISNRPALEALYKAYKKSPSPALKIRIDKLEAQLGSAPPANIPKWYDYLNKILNGRLVELPKEQEKFPFSIAFIPLLSIFTDELRQKFPDMPQEIINSAQVFFMKRLLQIAGVTLYTDYQKYCREKNTVASLQTYHEWAELYCCGRWEALAYEYPVLIRFLHATHLNFQCHTSEVLYRYKIDREEISQKFNIPIMPDYPLNIEFDLSDFHHNGRTVCRLSLNQRCSIIYKPKSMANEEWFFEKLLPLLPSFHSSIGYINIIDKKNYGWAENINHSDNNGSTDNRQIDIGYVIALFYALNATDMHAENILIKDQKIYPLDLETIFNAPPHIYSSDGKEWKKWSVLATELLSYHFSYDIGGNRGNGFSAEAAYAPFKKLYFLPCDREGVQIDLYDPQNFNDENSAEKSVVSSILNQNALSFRKAFGDITNLFKKNLLQPPEGVTRHIFRDTMFYERIIQRLSQPKLLSNGENVSLDLAGLYLQLKEFPEHYAYHYASIIDDEITQLLNGDVPLFFHDMKSEILMSYNGSIADNFFKINGYQCFLNKIHETTDADLLEQEHLIEASFFIKPQKIKTINPVADEVFDKCYILNQCQKIAHLIIERAITQADKNSYWVSYISDTSGRNMRPAVVGNSYYSGYWGIIFFLSAAQSTFKIENMQSDVIDKFLLYERKYWDQETEVSPQYIKETGLGLAGIAGEIQALTFFIDSNPSWKFAVKRLISILNNIDTLSVSQDPYLDVIGGNAGLIISLVNLHTSRASRHLSYLEKRKMEAMISLACRRLCEAALEQHQGVAWLPKKGEKRPLLGYAHGTAGIITALQKFISLAREINLDHTLLTDAKNTLKQALIYQTSQQSYDGNNWIDRREHVKKDSSLNSSWCHGWSGLGLGLISQINTNNSAEVANDLNILKKIIHTESNNNVDYYCCGNCGEADFLLEMHRLTSDQDLLLKAKGKIANSLQNLDNMAAFSSRFGLSDPKLFPGLFQGISGIGYTALRLINESLPSLVGYTNILPTGTPRLKIPLDDPHKE
jgi:lantibiotic modifying enzyme